METVVLIKRVSIIIKAVVQPNKSADRMFKQDETESRNSDILLFVIFDIAERSEKKSLVMIIAAIGGKTE